MKRLVSLILTVIMMLSGLTAFAETENAPKELHYTPGEDLVIAEKDGIRIILKGRQNDDFGEFIEPWDAYNWYTLLVDNDTEFDVALKYSSVVDGIGTTGKNSTNFGGYRKHSSEEWEITLRTEVYKNSDGTIDEEALHSNSAQAVDEVYSSDTEVEVNNQDENSPVDDFLVKFEVRNAIAKKSSCGFILLEDCHSVAHIV